LQRLITWAHLFLKILKAEKEKRFIKECENMEV